jgi:hypothetical protein
LVLHASIPRKIIAAWNVLGSLDLVLAVWLGVLGSATPWEMLEGDVSTRLMGRTFFVPLLL